MARINGNWFGRRPPTGGVTVAWGARAILKSASFPQIDLPRDRQSWTKARRDDRSRLARWINTKGLPWLRDEIKRARLASIDHKVIEYDDGPIHLEASPQSSGGYLYIGAWEHQPIKSLRRANGKQGRVLPWNRIRNVRYSK
jgi:hypothetical protein